MATEPHGISDEVRRAVVEDLISIREIGELLDVSRQRAHLLVDREGFPPSFPIEGREFFSRTAVLLWAERWNETPQRRRKLTKADQADPAGKTRVKARAKIRTARGSE